jgi:hypothetical protein
MPPPLQKVITNQSIGYSPVAHIIHLTILSHTTSTAKQQKTKHVNLPDSHTSNVSFNNSKACIHGSIYMNQQLLHVLGLASYILHMIMVS